jgi:hypothetical protein
LKKQLSVPWWLKEDAPPPRFFVAAMCGLTIFTVSMGAKAVFIDGSKAPLLDLLGAMIAVGSLAQAIRLKRLPSPVATIKRESIGPPHGAEFLLYVMLPKSQRESLPGDLEEEFHLVERKFGPQHARIWYWSEVARSVGPILLRFVRRVLGLTALWQVVSKVLQRLG